MPEEINELQIDVEGTIRAAGDSEDLVRRLVTEGEHSQEVHDTIQRNIGHLSHILSQEPIATSGSARLAGFQAAVKLGADFIAAAE